MSILNRFKTLPPFVKNVEYSAYLTLCLASLKIKETIKRMSDSYRVRLIWWGESECSHFRHSITYSIAPQVFETYLRYCELLELTITNRGTDIGSACIYNTVEIFEKPQLRLPVVDHSGSIIGELIINVKIHYPMAKKEIIERRPAYRFMSILNNLQSLKDGNVPKEVADYLSGVNLSNSDEKTALDLLKDWSPGQSVVLEFMNALLKS